MAIGENLKYWMDVRHITAAKLAAKCNVPETTITKIRTGVTQNPNIDTLERLADGLEITVNDLLDIPVVDEQELRDLLPKNLPGVSDELLATVLTTLRNQRIASDRALAEVRKDRNFWRKVATICLSIIIPVTIATLVILCIMYWDLSHPTLGSIIRYMGDMANYVPNS